MNHLDAFKNTKLKKKIEKTREARGGGGIYKRRNNRSNRVIIHYNTYLKILKKDKKILDNYTRGYVVRIKPGQYFNENGTIKTNFHNSLKLGINAFLYFKTIKDWKKYKSYCSNLNEIVELHTRSNTIDNNKQWIGEYCTNITNSDPSIISLICTTKKEKEKSDILQNQLRKLQKKYKKLPAQAGIGNFDIDFASEEEIKKVEYQLCLMIFKIKGIEKELKARNSSLTDLKIKEVKNHIIDFCKKKKLDNFEKLVEIRALDETNYEPICPLCKEKLNAESFFLDAEQDEGREEEDNTSSAIVLMHIDALRPMEFNHHTYNLGWGHKDCNTIQGPKSISDTLDYLKEILRKNNLIK